ncbi:hypothetical protein H6F89_15525 [Cyanobacteria bacterium FACHB-63]|nr:hypothetical protein [Cyanobacteria bacterium FACHB-63]
MDKKASVVDAGADQLKILAKRRSKPVCMPSTIQFIRNENAYSGHLVLSNSVFKCHRSTCKTIDKKFWTVKTSPILFSEQRYEEVGMNDSLKISNALPLYLSGLIIHKLIEPGETRIRLRMTHHDPMGAAEELRNSMVGAHEIEYQGVNYQVVIHMPTDGVLQEGEFVIAKPGTPHVILDLGYLTNLITAKDEDGSRISSTAGRNGVNKLAKLIRQSRQFKTTPDLLAIRHALRNYQKIENESPEYTMPCNIEGVKDLFPLYMEYLEDWLKCAMAEALYARHLSTGQKF